MNKIKPQQPLVANRHNFDCEWNCINESNAFLKAVRSVPSLNRGRAARLPACPWRRG
jgi:hypothetical protein